MSVKVHEAFSIDSFQDRLLWWDDFLGDQLKDEWRDAGTGSAAVVDAQTGGIVRLTTGATTNDAYLIDWATIRSLLVIKKLSIEFRLKLNQTTNVSAMPYFRFDWDNCIIWNYSTAIGGNWMIRTRDGGGNTTQDSGIAADTNYHIFRIECHTHGASHVHFYIDPPTECAFSPITTNIPDDPGDYLQPYLIIQTLEDAVKSTDIDYIVVRQEI